MDHDEDWRTLLRTCEDCGERYSINDFLETQAHYFPHPYNYRKGCETHCLACWLGVGPNDFPGEDC